MNNVLAKAIIVIAFLLGYVYVMTSQNYMAAPPKVAPVVKKSKKLGSIVRLVDQGRTFCSGTVINDHTILTAAHCVLVDTMMGPMLNQDPIEIRVDDNISHGVFATAFFASGQMDQALLTGDFKLFEVRNYLSDAPKLTLARTAEGNFISCGYPLGGNLYCSNTLFLYNFQFMWRVHGVLLPGMSGGPTMLQDGTVVAVNCAVEGADSIVSPIYNIDQNLGKVK